MDSEGEDGRERDGTATETATVSDVTRAGSKWREAVSRYGVVVLVVVGGAGAGLTGAVLGGVFGATGVSLATVHSFSMRQGATTDRSGTGHLQAWRLGFQGPFAFQGGSTYGPLSSGGVGSAARSSASGQGAGSAPNGTAAAGQAATATPQTSGATSTSAPKATQPGGLTSPSGTTSGLLSTVTTASLPAVSAGIPAVAPSLTGPKTTPLLTSPPILTSPGPPTG
jgi:hypothetical protein